ncbi:hypothetical protein OIT44_04765 [Weissella ceti]|uniref:Uncharacterized protein n=1 Tax=Weissella ceti TaxID=759620 RepID=A0ABT3E4N3_9LACO|nr:hypothetical protein [Weissella ceti]MCW0953385.1 hypothetical protein [Weissella ceti]QVK11989.1 hypothetical protein KHQ31_07210 [Weissella ceti]
MLTKITWFSLIGVILIATIAMIFVFPYAWAKWTFAGLALFEVVIFYLLDLLRKSAPAEEKIK